uniref:ATP synthase F0 subunit 6 n=1 Tax=Platygaster robiniae TaxID=2753657 RepID=UPI002113FDC9|nr:ATP synthase F0 subunit 6 [Platygaster robiniae]UTI38868.1 ATP synthase F0 subunit 6 [Platygaster robiniae]
MMNIFSIFDPSTSMSFSLNWLSNLYIMMIIPSMLWMTPNRKMLIQFMFMNYMINELKMILFKKIYNIYFFSLFMMIMMNNFMGLFSYIFTSSSHMTMTLSLALPLWLTLMLIGWLFNTNHMFSHQLPIGTPSILMPFMVMIEFISNIIRPLTLSVRLMANMVAGHLLLTLISNNGPKMMFIPMMIMITSQMTLMMLEMSVSIIQAYVFTILASLYSNEIN